VAAEVYGHPATALRVIGVTGTQGKTTTTRLLESGLTGAGVPAAVIGTVGTRVLGTEVASALTTPEAPDLHGLLALMVERGVEVCAMEVSSHALVQGRVDGIVFDVAVFLNLGRDHLDFHHDMEDYFSAKASLFTPTRARTGLVDVDGTWGRRLLDRAEVPVQTLSAAGNRAEWCAVDIALGPTGSRFRIVGPDASELAAGCPIPGAFNVANTLAAVAAAGTVGYDAALVADGIARSVGVPGRLELVDEGQDFPVVVDYAHKPDAIEAALETLRPLTDGRLIVVLGAGGDRDPGKRPLMGRIAAAGADVLVVTDDNPRSEDPAAIRAAILDGIVEPSATVLEIADRRSAIAEAVSLAGAGDVVLVAGKGHETGQEIAGVVHPFDDRTVVREELRR
jgi:UDP-N-acetylmuramoyl-L-alanyl-D-glutamate--2,6-diaminopimelate ligase